MSEFKKLLPLMKRVLKMIGIKEDNNKRGLRRGRKKGPIYGPA